MMPQKSSLSVSRAFSICRSEDNEASSSVSSATVKSQQQQASFEQQFEISDPRLTLGQGGSSVVKLCTRKADQKTFAVKIVRHVDQELKEKYLSEFQMMKNVKEDRVCRYVELYFNEIKAEIYLVLELCTGTDIQKLVFENDQILQENDVFSFCQNLLSTIASLNADYKICHRDIQPENVFLEGEKIKVIDFNVARKF